MNIVITLTTIPSRLINQYNYDLEYCIKSLMEQNYDDYQIHFNIPESHKQTDGEYILPDWLVELGESDDKLTIFRTEDYGPVTKLYPTVKRIDDEETIIIVVDDDIIYNPEMINEHLKNREKWPDYPVGYDGLTSINDDGSRRVTFENNRDYFSLQMEFTHMLKLSNIIRVFHIREVCLVMISLSLFTPMVFGVMIQLYQLILQ